MFFHSTHYIPLLLFTALHVLRKTAVRNTSADLQRYRKNETDNNLFTPPLDNIYNQFPHHWAAACDSI